METTESAMSREEMKALFKRHKGSMTRVAKSLGHTSHVSVSLWFSGRFKSRPIETAVARMAQQLLKKEERHATRF